METELTGGYLTGRCVLVTGAGGSIGAELCRQIARVGPERLVLIDHAEDNLFEIERELVEDRHALNTCAVLADCKEEERMREVFAQYRPTVVFHAAAYKHVGLMESNPVEAVRNNALATRVDGARGRRHRDEGVRARLDRQGRGAGDRDGRVEGARRVGRRGRRPPLPRDVASAPCGSATCSAPPARSCRSSAARSRPAGPVTVTDSQMTRFFMTIPEAVQLVIRSGSLARGGEVFVLDMGDPVSILDLAKDMIRFAQLEPGKDIAIEIIGRAPGREAPRGAVQHLRAARAHARGEDPARRAARDRPRVGGGDVQPDRPARARGRCRRTGRDRCRAGGGARSGGGPGARPNLPPARARSGRRAPPTGSPPRITSSAQWQSYSRSRSSMRSRSTAPTSGLPRFSASPS